EAKGTRSFYTDLEISEVSSLLKHLNPSWSKIPRTYIVLRTIGRLDLIEEFIDFGFSDHWFPITQKFLPQSLNPKARSDFLNAKYLILTKSVDLEKGERGRHHHFKQDEPLPFERKEILGRGGSGQVDRVLSLISFKEYARKKILRRDLFNNRGTEAVKSF